MRTSPHMNQRELTALNRELYELLAQSNTNTTYKSKSKSTRPRTRKHTT